jgi:2,3-bisphosphoglycerate-independent phosphoglycerate mutase
MSDWPVEELENKTPLEYSKTPNLDFVATHGVAGWAKTVPQGIAPGSDIANLSIFGYDPVKYYTGRAPLEAASLGILLGPDEVAYRCNLVTIEDGKMKDFTAGHISTEDAAEIIELLNAKLGSDKIKFYTGLSYRHLMVVKNGPIDPKCTPPHDITGELISDKIPHGKGSELLRDLMKQSAELLSDHLINKKRKNPANMIWLWGQGMAPDLPKFYKKYKLTGSVITAVPLIKGIGIFAGLKPIDVKGATGFIDTNYEGKVSAALSTLKENDIVFIHIEAPDETGHMGETKLKVQAIEDFDKKVVGPVLKGLKKFKDFRVLVLPDHPTPLSIMTHASDPVPFAVYGEGKGSLRRTASSYAKAAVGKIKGYSEKAVGSSKLTLNGHDLISKILLK